MWIFKDKDEIREDMSWGIKWISSISYRISLNFTDWTCLRVGKLNAGYSTINKLSYNEHIIVIYNDERNRAIDVRSALYTLV